MRKSFCQHYPESSAFTRLTIFYEELPLVVLIYNSFA